MTPQMAEPTPGVEFEKQVRLVAKISGMWSGLKKKDAASPIPEGRPRLHGVCPVAYAETYSCCCSLFRDPVVVILVLVLLLLCLWLYRGP
jgi:hypothetical protein